MRSNRNFLCNAIVTLIMVLFFTSQTVLAGIGYWDLISVNLTPDGSYWAQANSPMGGLLDPIVHPDPNGVPVIDTGSSLGGVTYGFGGANFGDGTLEGTATIGNTLELLNATDYHYYLNITLDTNTLPHVDQVFPSWGTVYDIVVQPSDGANGWLAPIDLTWTKSPTDPNTYAQVVPSASTIKLAPSDFGDAENGNQTNAIYGAVAVLPDAPGYKVTFSTNLQTWDSYNDINGGGPPPGVQNYSQAGAVEYPLNMLPNVAEVPGKEFSNYPQDKNATWANDALQNLAFNGMGAVSDTYDYSGSAVSPNTLPNESNQVDALANAHDAYYWAAAQDQVPIVVSFGGVNPSPAGNIYYQMGKIDNTGIWCPYQQVKSPTSNLDALELYGPDNMGNPPGDDSNMFSLLDDPGGVAVWQYNASMHKSLPYITSAQLKAALGIVGEVSLDLDALMVYDNEPEGGVGGFVWGEGDSIMFSVKDNEMYDGGEIWRWIYGEPAQFLVHGGEVWDTAHNVGAHFGTGIEEIDALEAVAVPEPATLFMLIIGAICLLLRRGKKVL
jgi:hypothetical protein